jgi:hypothetical protein
VSKTVPIRILLGLVLAISFSTSAHADTYPTVTFAYPIIDENIVESLTNQDQDYDFQSITVTPYIYDIGSDIPISESAVEDRGYHVFYATQNDPEQILDLNQQGLSKQDMMDFVYFHNGTDYDPPVFWNNPNLESSEDANLEGFIWPYSYPVFPHLNGDLTQIEDVGNFQYQNMAIAYLLNVDTLQSWITLVDSYYAANRYPQQDLDYLDFHRQIGTYEGPNIYDATQFSSLTDSYFRVYRTGSFFVDGPTEEEIAAEAARVAAEAARVAAEAARVAAEAARVAAEAARVAAVQAAQSAADAAQALKMAPKTDFSQCYSGSDKLADPKGEIRGMLDEINQKYGNLIKF